MKSFQVFNCAKCGGSKIKRWDQLTEDQQFLIKKIETGKDSDHSNGQGRRFCARCLSEIREEVEGLA